MNIGIISMQKIHNYGSFLQAFSLKNQFEMRGHKVYFVDIAPGEKIVSEVSTETTKASKLDKYIFKRIEHLLISKIMDRIHISDYKTYLNTDKIFPNDKTFDLVVIGSDEVFNVTEPSPWGFSRQLFGEVNNTKRVVTYAASCGSTTYEKAKELDIISDIKDCLCHITSISVRDDNTRFFVEKITGKDALLHVDPVFLTDFDSFIPEKCWKKPYILIYAYGNRIDATDEIKAIFNYAKKNGLDILSVGMCQRWCKNVPATAFELLSYVKNAQYIITDTFHGTVFSIKYNKQFCTLIRDSNRNKLGDLLKQFGLMNRCVNNMNDFNEILDTPIDWKTVNDRVEKEINLSREYLDKICEDSICD